MLCERNNYNTFGLFPVAIINADNFYDNFYETLWKLM